MNVPDDIQKKFSRLDPSVAAANQLNAILEEAEIPKDLTVVTSVLPPSPLPESGAVSPDVLPLVEAEAEAQRRITADQVRRGAPLLSVTSDRDSVRLLLFTKNVSVRQLGSLAQKRLMELSKIFAEIHVIILNEFTEQTVSTVRLTDNVWLYSTDSNAWWKIGFDAYRIATEQLIFAGAFRADVVVAEDPFESGVVAHFVSKKYNRPFQVHVLDDIYDPGFNERSDHNVWRSLIAPFSLKRANCIRTGSGHIREKLIEEYEGLAPITEVLPLYYNLESWKDMPPRFSLHARYPRFNFFILHVSNMQLQSHTAEVIHGVTPLLRAYPTMGLIIIGNGPHRSALEKQVIALGIQRQVEFEPIPDEIISHMKSANLLVHLSEDPFEDMIVLQAATVRLPIVASVANIAGVLFKDNDSAFLCSAADPACVSQKLKLFLRDTEARTRLGFNAEQIVFERIEQDYTSYLHAYRSSVERCTAGTSQVA